MCHVFNVILRTKHAKGKSQSVVTDGHDDYVFDFSNNNYTSIRGCKERGEKLYSSKLNP